jgi:hypothetical protein
VLLQLLKNFVQTSFLLALLSMSSAVQAEPNNAVKLELKMTVMKYIEKHTDNDNYLFVDPDTLKASRLQFITMHPVVFETEPGRYILCADFTSKTGDTFLLDYFVININDTYEISTVVQGKRSLLSTIAEKFSLKF